MDIRQMRQVLAIHRHGSLGKAGAALGVSQPTLSKSLARLEDELRLTLFVRTAAGAVPTAMGALIVERAERIIGEAERLARDVELVGAGQLGEVRIGIGATLRPTFLADFAEAVARAYPKLRLELTTGDRDLLVGDLRSGAKDLILILDGDDLDPRETARVELFSDVAIAVAAPRHPLAGRSSISIEEFAEFPCVSPTPGSGFAVATLLGLSGEAAQRANHFLTNDFEPAFRLIGAGLATGIGPSHLLQPEIAAGRMVRLPLDWSFKGSFVAAMTPAASHSPVVRGIVRMAQAALAWTTSSPPA